jgi:hypothetical protein
MREIKFRAWNLLAYGGGMVTEENSGLKSFQILERFSNVMQYTGRKDKNGVDIYEGDTFFDDEVLCTVEWDKHTLRWIVTSDYGCIPLYANSEIAITGNIHENPELL